MMSATARTLARASAFIFRVRPVACSYSSASGQGQSNKGGGASGGDQKQKPGEQQPKPEKPEAQEVDNTKYQAEELYQYNPMSFYDIEKDMSESRLEQPSSIKPKPS